MRRKIQKPTQHDPGKHDDRLETHPAWGLIGASRVTSSPGAVLFDSDILHRSYVMVRLHQAQRRRSLIRDWLHADRKTIVEIAMSEAQWASFVSTMNVGSGVPCTIDRIDMKQVPGMPHEPRLVETMDEVSKASEKAIEKIQKAFEEVERKPNKANIKTLRHTIENLPGNMRFAADSLSEHTENVVQRARADIEAMVVSKAEQLGLDPSDLGSLNLLKRPEE